MLPKKRRYRTKLLYQKWKRRYHHRSHGHYKDNKRILQTTLIHKFDNLDEMDQFLEKHNLPKLIQKEIDDLTIPISIKEIDSMIDNLLKWKAPDPDGFNSEFYQILHLRKKLYQFSTISFRGYKWKEYFLTHLNRITLIPKPKIS